MVFSARSADDLTQSTKAALRNGYFSGQLIVDSTGKALKVGGAKKLHGVGPFCGYNVFLNQRIKVELQLDGELSQVDLSQTRERVLKALRGSQGWDAGDDADALIASVEQAKSISDIASIITEAYYRTYRIK